MWSTPSISAASVLAAGSSIILINGGFNIRGPAGEYYAIRWTDIGDPASSQGRTELVRYDSPTWQGFTASASIAEAGDYWGTMLRYANEFNGVRVAAGIGYENITDRQTNACLLLRHDASWYRFREPG